MNTDTLKKIFFILLIAIVALLVQGGFKLVTNSFPARNLFLIIVVYLGFFEVSLLGAVLAFFVGLLIDLSGGVLIGPAAGAACLTYGLLAALSGRIFIESSAAIGVAVMFSALLNGSIVILISSQFAPGIFGFAWRLLGEALLSALFAPLIFPLLRKLVHGSKDRSSNNRISVRSRSRMNL